VKSINSFTHQFLRVIGSPFVSPNRGSSTQNLSGLYHYAIENRMPLLCLEALRKLDRLGSLQKEYDALIDKYAKTERVFYRVSKVLDKAGIRYAFFKSIRPYQEVTVDIDILIFGSKYKEAIRSIHGAGYMLLDSGPLSTTFRDSEARINLDIYDEVGVSHIVYLDKNILTKLVGNKELSNGAIVRSLYPEAELLVIIAHSVIKEHMYVLSEYYTTLHYLAGMKYEALSSFLSLVDKCRMRSAVKTHLGITALLHYGAHNTIPVCLIGLLKTLDTNHLELSRVAKMGFHMPYRYHPITIIKAFIEKLGEEKARRSFSSQTLNMLNPTFTSSVLKKTLDHIFRETY